MYTGTTTMHTGTANMNLDKNMHIGRASINIGINIINAGFNSNYCGLGI